MFSTQSPPPELPDTNGITNESTKGSLSLENILGEHHEDVEYPTTPPSGAAAGWDEEETAKPLLNGYCIECEGLHSLFVSM